jgi:hypothetical protein
MTMQYRRQYGDRLSTGGTNEPFSPFFSRFAAFLAARPAAMSDGASIFPPKVATQAGSSASVGTRPRRVSCCEPFGYKTKYSTSFVERKPTLKLHKLVFVLNLPVSVFLLRSAVKRMCWLNASLPNEDGSLPTCLWLVYCSSLLTLTAGVLVSGIGEFRK